MHRCRRVLALIYRCLSAPTAIHVCVGVVVSPRAMKTNGINEIYVASRSRRKSVPD